MDNKSVNNGSTSKYVNWLTVWGLVAGGIAFNVYFDNRQTTDFRAQYENESHRADSLYRETIRLEQRLQVIETGSAKSVSTQQPAASWTKTNPSAL